MVVAVEEALMTTAFTTISALAAFAIAWSTIAFHGWVRAQRQPKPVFLDGRLVLDTTFPAHLLQFGEAEVTGMPLP